MIKLLVQQIILICVLVFKYNYIFFFASVYFNCYPEFNDTLISDKCIFIPNFAHVL